MVPQSGGGFLSDDVDEIRRLSDLAIQVFDKAYDLGRKLRADEDEESLKGGAFTPPAGYTTPQEKFWDEIDAFVVVVANCRPAYESKHHKLIEVRRWLDRAGIAAKTLRTLISLHTAEASLDTWGMQNELNSIGYEGHKAIRSLEENLRINDPLAFLDESNTPAVKPDTTPPQSQLYGASFQVGEAIHQLQEIVYPNFEGLNVHASTTAFITAWQQLGGTLELAKNDIRNAPSGRGLLRLWLRAVARRVQSAQSNIQRYPQKHALELLKNEDDHLLWLVRDGATGWIQISGWMSRKPADIAPLLDESTTPVKQLRNLEAEWRTAFEDAPSEPGPKWLKVEVLNAWQPWAERRNTYLEIAGRLVLECINQRLDTDWLSKDSDTCEWLIRSMPAIEGWIQRQLKPQANAEAFSNFLDQIIGPKQKPKVTGGVPSMKWSSEAKHQQAGSPPELPTPIDDGVTADLLTSSLQHPPQEAAVVAGEVDQPADISTQPAKASGIEADLSSGSHPSDYAKLEEDTPALDRKNGKWLSNKKAAQAESVETRSLAKYRYKGYVNSDSTFGVDCDQRIWRREGTPTSHPWYLKSSLVAYQKP